MGVLIEAGAGVGAPRLGSVGAELSALDSGSVLAGERTEVAPRLIYMGLV
jgi:hypothetical protein